MANKRFPADMADITADYAHMLVAKADGTVGWATPCLAKSGGTLTGTLSGTTATFSGNVSSSDGGTNQSILGNKVLDFYNAAITPGSLRVLDNGSTIDAITMSKSGSSANIGIPNGSLIVSGTVTAQGNVLTSAREKKHVFGELKTDALSQISQLKLHRFSYRKHETEVLEPVTINKKGEVAKEAKTRTVELPAPDQPDHIGLMYDEVQDNPDIATPDGAIKLHNLVFLQARAIQQLVARIEALENTGKTKK